MRILLPPYNGFCCLHAKTGLWVSVNPWGQNNTQFGLARWNAHRLWHLCLWMWTSPLQYWKQFKVYVLTPWLWIVSIHVIPFIFKLCYIWNWPWSYTLLLTFNAVDTVVYVKFACELVFVNLPVFLYMFMLLPLSMWKLPVMKKKCDSPNHFVKDCPHKSPRSRTPSPFNKNYNNVHFKDKGSKKGPT